MTTQMPQVKTAVLTLVAALAAAPVALAASSQDRAAADRAIAHVESGRAAMQLPEATGFASRAVFHDNLNQTHVRLVQYHDGVKVFGGEAVVHLQGDEVLSVTNDLKGAITIATEPTLADNDAVAIAHAALAPAGKYNVEPTAELVIFRRENGRDFLAYHVHTELENSFETRHDDFIVDAHSGRVIERWNSLHTATGSGNSQYSGNVSLDTNLNGTSYELKDLTRNTSTGNRTFNLNHATSGTGTLYTDGDNGWGDGANYVEGSSTTAANGQTAAVDAHFGMASSWDYFELVHGRNGIDGTGKATYSRVHYSNSYDNAFWSDTCFCMTYGDGSTFTTLTSMDVAGHEMSHGVTATTARLAYRRESGGLNESTSDIFGTAIEFYSGSSGGGNWKIGEQLRANGTPLRYMYNPSLDGRSANCWSKQTGGLDVHYSSGVGNHFFYLLSQGSAGTGGSPTSPTCNGLAVSGIGLAKAEKIWFRALTAYMTSSTTYAGARTATLNAATDLFGAASAERAAVAAAWTAVNVN